MLLFISMYRWLIIIIVSMATLTPVPHQHLLILQILELNSQTVSVLLMVMDG